MSCVDYNNKSYLLDAFYDERIEGIRLFIVGLIQIVPIPQLYLVYDDKEIVPQIIIHKDNKFTKVYGSYLLFDNATSRSEIPKYVRFNNYKIPVIYHSPNIKPKYNQTMCVGKVMNYSSVNHFIQIVESNRRFGMDHMVIYLTSCSKEMEIVLDYYQKKGIVEVIKWNFNVESGVVYQYDFGVLWKINDCFYRYRLLSKRILILDLDETLWSERKQSNNNNNMNDLELFMKKNEHCSAFYFRQRLYHREIFNAFDRYISNLTDADIFAYREYCELKKKRIQKYLIYNTRNVTNIEVHFVHGYYKGFKKCYVPIEIAYARHYRRISNSHLKYCNSSLLMDKEISEDEKEIKKEVEIVKNELNIHPTFRNDVIILNKQEVNESRNEKNK